MIVCTEVSSQLFQGVFFLFLSRPAHDAPHKVMILESVKPRYPAPPTPSDPLRTCNIQNTLSLFGLHVSQHGLSRRRRLQRSDSGLREKKEKSKENKQVERVFSIQRIERRRKKKKRATVQSSDVTPFHTFPTDLLFFGI